MKIGEIKPFSIVKIRARVLFFGTERLVSEHRKKPLRICKVKIGDETGMIDLMLYDNEINEMKNEIGNVISITDGVSRLYEGRNQLSLGDSGAWKKVKNNRFPSKLEIMEKNAYQLEEFEKFDEDLSELEAETVNINQILPNMRVTTKVRIFSRGKIKYLGNRRRRKLRVREFLVGDKTGITTYTAFNDEIEDFGEFYGDVINLKNCWAKFWKNSVQISRGKRGEWEYVNDPEFISQEDLLHEYNSTKLEITDQLNPGRVYFSEIVGIKYRPEGHIIREKEAATKLRLVPEPENPYDDKAVGVWFKDKMVGYIPRRQNKAIFKALIDNFPKIECMLGIYVPRLESRYCLPSESRNVPVTISTYGDKVEWRPLVLLPEDLMAI